MAVARVRGGVDVGQREWAAELGQRGRRSGRRERGRGKGRISVRLFFLYRNDYIAPLLIVLERLVS